ncbi:MAG: hypothetical protein AB1632_08035 [Nitrospirota bacterium]
MVALAILGVAVVAIFQLFSASLRSAKKADDYSKALFYARAMLDEAYSVPDPSESSTSLKFEGNFEGSREINLQSSSDDGNVKLYEIIVTVTWPPSGNLQIKGLRTVYESEQ